MLICGYLVLIPWSLFVNVHHDKWMVVSLLGPSQEKCAVQIPKSLFCGWYFTCFVFVIGWLPWTEKKFCFTILANHCICFGELFFSGGVWVVENKPETVLLYYDSEALLEYFSCCCLNKCGIVWNYPLHFVVIIKPSHYRVYQLLGESGTYYGVRFGKNIPWVTQFPFGVIQDPQYVGSILSLFACLSWTPFQYILLWTLGYVFMIYVESKEDPATRAKPISWLQMLQFYRLMISKKRVDGWKMLCFSAL